MPSGKLKFTGYSYTNEPHFHYVCSLNLRHGCRYIRNGNGRAVNHWRLFTPGKLYWYGSIAWGGAVNPSLIGDTRLSAVRDNCTLMINRRSNRQIDQKTKRLPSKQVVSSSVPAYVICNYTHNQASCIDICQSHGRGHWKTRATRPDPFPRQRTQVRTIRVSVIGCLLEGRQPLVRRSPCEEIRCLFGVKNNWYRSIAWFV